MGYASIPTDTLNPGQVFACLGFLEVADLLCGGAEGGFDWREGPGVLFELASQAEDNPVEAVLSFLVEAQVYTLAPTASYGALVTSGCDILEVDTFPASSPDDKTLPVRLRGSQCREWDLTYWCDDSEPRPFRLRPFKLFAGQQRSVVIVREMLEAVRTLWSDRKDDLIKDPFGVLAPLGGSSFKLDARKWWTAIDAGYSPDDQKHSVEASPVVEILGAVGLEHTRPDESGDGRVRYGIWSGKLPPVLARPALGGVSVGVPIRVFEFALARSGQNRVVTFAEEVTRS